MRQGDWVTSDDAPIPDFVRDRIEDPDKYENLRDYVVRTGDLSVIDTQLYWYNEDRLSKNTIEIHKKKLGGVFPKNALYSNAQEMKEQEKDDTDEEEIQGKKGKKGKRKASTSPPVNTPGTKKRKTSKAASTGKKKGHTTTPEGGSDKEWTPGNSDKKSTTKGNTNRSQSAISSRMILILEAIGDATLLSDILSTIKEYGFDPDLDALKKGKNYWVAKYLE